MVYVWPMSNERTRDRGNLFEYAQKQKPSQPAFHGDCTIDGTAYSPTEYTSFQPPAKGGSYTDPVFGTAIKRVSDSMHTADIGRGGVVSLISTAHSPAAHWIRRSISCRSLVRKK